MQWVFRALCYTLRTAPNELASLVTKAVRVPVRPLELAPVSLYDILFHRHDKDK